MKHSVQFIVLFSLVVYCGLITPEAQAGNPFAKGPEYHKKGSLFLYYGWNRGWYTNSNIRFHGNGYDFKLHSVIAHDRQSEIAIDPYLVPTRFTFPQYDARLGYFLSDHYSISFGNDHMKYVVDEDQVVSIDGYIHGTETKFDGEYENDEIAISSDFISYEHTDGLNYENIELRRFDEIFNWGIIRVNFEEGFGVGMMLPRTETYLWTQERYDEFHVSGYGLNGVAAVNVSLFQYFFLQTEMRGGFIHMPDVRTSKYKADRASQHFFFSSWVVAFGGVIPLVKHKD